MLNELLDRYNRQRLVGRSNQTKLLMGVSVRVFADFLGREPLICDLTDENLSAFASARLLKVARATVQQNQLKLLALWRFACQLGLRKEWPTIRPIRLPERTPAAWTEQELSKLFGAISEAPGRVGAVPAPTWWRALHLLLWDTGERFSAIIKAEWSHYDQVNGRLWVPAENRKGKTRDKTYRLDMDTRNCLADFPNKSGAILHWPMDPGYIYAKYRKLLKAAGLPTDRDSMFHRMRRSVASHLKAAGGDATAAMDHDSARTTAGYIDPRICPSASPADLLFRPSVVFPSEAG